MLNFTISRHNISINFIELNTQWFRPVGLLYEIVHILTRIVFPYPDLIRYYQILHSNT